MPLIPKAHFSWVPVFRSRTSKSRLGFSGFVALSSHTADGQIQRRELGGRLGSMPLNLMNMFERQLAQMSCIWTAMSDMPVSCLAGLIKVCELTLFCRKSSKYFSGCECNQLWKRTALSCSRGSFAYDSLGARGFQRCGRGYMSRRIPGTIAGSRINH